MKWYLTGYTTVAAGATATIELQVPSGAKKYRPAEIIFLAPTDEPPVIGVKIFRGNTAILPAEGEVRIRGTVRLDVEGLCELGSAEKLTVVVTNYATAEKFLSVIVLGELE